MSIWGPFSLGTGPDACLLLHGFTGSPYEVRPLGEALARHGVRAVGIMLPGHGRSPEALLTVDRHDLLEAARGALRELKGARRVFVCGLSAGALLTLELAAHLSLRHGDPDLAAIALLAPAVEFKSSSFLYANVLGHLPVPRALTLAKGGRDVGLAQPAELTSDLAPGVRNDGSYEQVPLGWARELRLLSSEAAALAHRVRTPAILLHGQKDNTAALSGTRKLADRLASRKVELRIFPESGHLLPLDREAAQVCESVVEFFARA
ncbi:MAG: alpha/beta fold hydrolase [Deltaproteobacteria bacterium]|nr:alpha/beta fold hydrolase [Deltaproteobacteria bacterium]